MSKVMNVLKFKNNLYFCIILSEESTLLGHPCFQELPLK